MCFVQTRLGDTVSWQYSCDALTDLSVLLVPTESGDFDDDSLAVLLDDRLDVRGNL